MRARVPPPAGCPRLRRGSRGCRAPRRRSGTSPRTSRPCGRSTASPSATKSSPSAARTRGCSPAGRGCASRPWCTARWPAVRPCAPRWTCAATTTWWHMRTPPPAWAAPRRAATTSLRATRASSNSSRATPVGGSSPRPSTSMPSGSPSATTRCGSLATAWRTFPRSPTTTTASPSTATCARSARSWTVPRTPSRTSRASPARRRRRTASARGRTARRSAPHASLSVTLWAASPPTTCGCGRRARSSLFIRPARWARTACSRRAWSRSMWRRPTALIGPSGGTP
mmetsp:Transcript_10191/g.42272  ORF Transcript_10191/g.42272 Transcript_10191/m.42272 type:complete len:284 (-) Transcript_10191:224-1075(-)